MFYLDCEGPLVKESTKNSFLLQELNYIKHSGASCTIENDLKSYANVILFKNDYHKFSSIEFHLDELFNLSRKYYQILSRAARNSSLSSMSLNSDYQDFGFLRRCLSDFFIHIRDSLSDINNILNNNVSIKAQPILSDLKQRIGSFQLMLKSIDILPDFVIRNSTSEIGNQCFLASFHLFHCHLELHWLHLVTSLKIISLEQLFKEGTLLDTEDDPFQPFPSTPVFNTSHNADIARELEWILYNLVLLSSKCYDKIDSKHIFSCSCVRQIWISTQMLIENLSNENKCADFWHYYNGIFKKFVTNSENMEITPKRCDSLYVMNEIVTSNRFGFGLSLLVNVAQLQGYNSDGEYVGVNSHRIVPNYTMLEDILKVYLNGDQGVPEIMFREQIHHVTKLLTVWWEPKNEIVTLIWEYFHKRLNSAFSVPGKEDNSVSLASSTVPNFINDLKLRLSLNCSSKRDHKSESSFSIFVTLLGIHLKKSTLSNQQGNCQRIKGRILPKFTLSKIQTLNELGLNHFTTLFLMMAISTDLTDICSKLQNLITQIPFDSLPWSKKQIVIKSHLSILYAYVESGIEISETVKPILLITNKYCFIRETEHIAIIKMVVSGMQDIMDASQDFKQNEYLLVDKWLTTYLSVCALPDLSNTLDSFTSLLTKLRILSSYHDVSSHDRSVSGMIDAFFTHIFSCIKSLYSNGVMALQIADTAFSFTKFVFENSFYAKKYESFEDTLKFFTLSETCNERVAHHYLVQILQDEQMASFLKENRSSADCVVHCWLKSTFVSCNAHSGDDSHLLLLMCQLPDFAALNFTPSCESGERNLCRFFHAIGMAWNNAQTFQEKCRMRERVNQYLKSLDKYVLSALKAPPSQEYVMQLFIVLGTLFLHCSPIIYSRAKTTCLLHTLISNVLLPPQVFMDKKIHPYVTASICKSWYMFMKGLYNLDYKNDIYIEKTMKDMIIQYLPYFANKTLMTKNYAYEISFRIIPSECSLDLQLEKYILEKISVHFISCRGKQYHIHACKALTIILHLATNTSNINLLKLIISCVLLSVCEQFMFSDDGSSNKKVSTQILESLCNSKYFQIDTTDNIKNDLKEMLFATCKKHLAFNSTPFFRLLQNHLSSLVPIMDEVLSLLDSEITKVERMRGVGFDHGLRNGLNEIIKNHSKLK